jgi:hypothetical protein
VGLIAPWFLAGLGLLGLPLYLHLLKRHKSEPKQFSSLMFFEKSMQADLKHRRLDYLLLLAMRLLLLLLIALAFAQPFLWRKAAAGGANSARVIVVDDSASMGAADRIAKAKSIASGLIQPNSKVAVFDSQLRFVTPADIQALQAGTSRSSLGELARALRSYQESIGQPLEVHLISDLQRSSMPAGFSDLRLGPGTKLVLHVVDEKEHPNWTVESVTAPSRVRDGKTAKVQATLTGFHTPAASKAVSLEVNGRAVAKQTVQIPANGRAKVEFNGLDLPYGYSKCAVSIDGGDTLPADDKYLFAVERTDPQRVVFVYGERAARSATYFRDALDAATGGAYTVESYSSGQVPNLDKASFVVLSDVGVYSDSAVKSYVERGGAALLVLGAASVGPGKAPVTGAVVKASRYASRGAERYQTLGSADDAYAAIAKAGRWEGVRFYQSVEVDPGTARVVARFTDQTPALLEQKVGEGTVITFTSTFDNVANDFPVQPSFVPFVEQLAQRLSGWQEAAVNLPVDSALDFKGATGSRAFEATDPDGKRALSLEETAKGAPLVLSRSGFWEVRRGAGRAQMIAANIDRRESDLEPMPKESAELWQSPGAETKAAAGASEGETKWPLAAWLLGIALLAGVLEALVAGRHLTREAA